MTVNFEQMNNISNIKFTILFLSVSCGGNSNSGIKNYRSLNNQINIYTSQIELYNAQTALLKSMSNLNAGQTELLNIKIPERKALALKKKAEAKQKLADVQGGNGAGRKLLEGTFFPEKEKRDKTTNGNLVDIETGSVTSDSKKASYLAD